MFSITKRDLSISFFSGTGAGGQYRNKHQNCVRLRHLESGVTTTGQSYRERSANLREAFNNLNSNAEFKVWLNSKIQEILHGKEIEAAVCRAMKPDNLKVELLINGVWENEN